MRPAAALAERLGLPVRDLDLLQQALIHSSYLHEHRDLAVGHNERLEYLGDSVVSLAISDALYRRHPDDDEGVLSARRASIVSTTGLARLAGRLSLGEYLLLGEGESQRGGRRRPALLASAFEAVIGAIYLDLGFDTASEFVVSLASPDITSDRPLGSLKSPKSRLQEFTQRLSGERPQYHLIEATGPDHDKVFRVEVAVGGRVIGVGEGHSRRLAETAAAAKGLDTLRDSAGELGAEALAAPELIEFEGPEGPPGYSDDDPWLPSDPEGSTAEAAAGFDDKSNELDELDELEEPWTEIDIDLSTLDELLPKEPAQDQGQGSNSGGQPEPETGKRRYRRRGGNPR